MERVPYCKYCGQDEQLRHLSICPLLVGVTLQGKLLQNLTEGCIWDKDKCMLIIPMMKQALPTLLEKQNFEATIDFHIYFKDVWKPIAQLGEEVRVHPGFVTSGLSAKNIEIILDFGRFYLLTHGRVGSGPGPTDPVAVRRLMFENARFKMGIIQQNSPEDMPSTLHRSFLGRMFEDPKVKMFREFTTIAEQCQIG